MNHVLKDAKAWLAMVKDAQDPQTKLIRALTETLEKAQCQHRMVGSETGTWVCADCNYELFTNG